MPKRPPKLSRGYTKVREWLFDSDDDTMPVPRLPVATSPAVPAHADCISPPPPKRMTFAAALTAKAAPSVTRRESVLPKSRPPPLPCFPSAYATGTDPVHVQSRTSRQPPLAAPAPTPAKGSMRDMQPPVSNGDLYVLRPPISTGHHHVLDGALWRTVAIKEKPKIPWTCWGRGIVDLRPTGRHMVAGRLLRHAISEAKRIISQVPCQHKIGMCKCSFERFMMYQHDESEWQPWVLCMLATTTTREGAFMMEASIILEFEKSTNNRDNNINWIKSCDYGGEGPKPPTDAHAEHVVYLAVLPIYTGWTQRMRIVPKGPRFCL